MLNSYQQAIDRIFDNNLEDYNGLTVILQDFYKARSIEIITELDERGLMTEDDLKIGGTD
jgi:hypothetical protein